MKEMRNAHKVQAVQDLALSQARLLQPRSHRDTALDVIIFCVKDTGQAFQDRAAMVENGQRRYVAQLVEYVAKGALNSLNKGSMGYTEFDAMNNLHEELTIEVSLLVGPEHEYEQQMAAEPDT